MDDTSTETSGYSRREHFSNENFASRVEDVREKVEKGEDKEGQVLKNRIIKNFEEDPSEAIYGTAASTYKSARASAEKAEKDPAELDKLVVSMRTFHEQLGLGEYRIKIQTEEGIGERERRKLIMQKALEDFENLPSKMADFLMRDYYEQRARANKLQQELTNTTSFEVYGEGLEISSLPIRERIRKKTYDLQRHATRAEVEADFLAELVGGTALREKVVQARTERRFFEEKTSEPFSGRSEEEVDQLVSARTVSLRQQLLDSGREDDARALDSMEEGDRDSLARGLLVKELEIEDMQETLKSSISTEDPEVIMGLVSKIKNKRFSLKTRVASAMATLGYQRVENARESLEEVRKEIATSGKLRSLPSKENISELFASFKELVESKTDFMGLLVKKKVNLVLNSALEKADNAVDAVEQSLEEMGNVLIEPIRNAKGATDRVLMDFFEEFTSRVMEIDSKGKRARLAARREFYDKRYKLGILGLAAKHRLGVETRSIIREAGLSERDKGIFQKARERLSQARERLAGREAEYNPYFDFFWEDVEQRVDEEIKEEKVEDEEEREKVSAERAPERVEENQIEQMGVEELAGKLYKEKLEELRKKEFIYAEPDTADALGRTIDEREAVEEAGPEAFLKEAKRKLGESVPEEEVSKGEDKLINQEKPPREGAKFWRVVELRKGDETKSRMLAWWDGEKLYLDLVNSNLESKDEEPESHFANTKEEARNKLTRTLDNLENTGWQVSSRTEGELESAESASVKAPGVEVAEKDEGEKTTDSIKEAQPETEEDLEMVQEKPEGVEEELEHDDLVTEELWERAKELREKKGKWRRDWEENNRPSDWQRYKDAVDRWGDALLDYKNFYNINLPLTRMDLEEDEDYKKYEDLNREMAEIYRETKGKEGEEKEKNLKDYENKIKVLYKFYNRLRDKGVLEQK